MATCIFLGGIIWVALGDVMIEDDQIVTEPGQQVVDLVALSGESYQIDVPRDQGP